MPCFVKMENRYKVGWVSVLGGFIHSMVASMAVATTAASGDGSDMAAAASGNASET